MEEVVVVEVDVDVDVDVDRYGYEIYLGLRISTYCSRASLLFLQSIHGQKEMALSLFNTHS